MLCWWQSGLFQRWKRVFYSHNIKWFDGSNLKTKSFIYDHDKWNGPTIINEHFDSQSISEDGNSLYFVGGNLGGNVVWKSNRIKTGWSDPEIYFKEDYDLYNFMKTNSGNMYVGSNYCNGSIYDYSTYDICKISISKTDTLIQSLGIPVNTKGFDGDFFIADDESFMIISANETENFECELYISYRKPDKTWTNPKSLGPLINNGIAHRWGQYVTPDNKYLFYTRGNNEKNCYIYWVRFDRLFETLKHTNFEPYLKTQIKDQIAILGKSFYFTVPDSTFIDDNGNETLTYMASMENGMSLPSWLSFNSRTNTFSGTPTTLGMISIKVTATDLANTFISCKFNIDITNM